MPSTAYSLPSGKDIQVYSMKNYSGIDEIEENGVTFAENALIKANSGS